ncbi:exonuclease family protein [Aphelenchoides avenae]|nr:exonuclease family protein [Aphelenchus avenae]
MPNVLWERSVDNSASATTIEQEVSSEASTQYVGYVASSASNGSIQQEQPEDYGGSSSYYGSSTHGGYSGYQAGGVYQQLSYGYMDPSLYAPEDPTYSYQQPAQYQVPEIRRPLLPSPPTAAAPAVPAPQSKAVTDKPKYSQHHTASSAEDVMVVSTSHEHPHSEEAAESSDQLKRRRPASPTGEFSVLKKKALPIDLANDEILNPSVRPVAPLRPKERSVAAVKPTLSHVNRHTAQASGATVATRGLPAKQVASFAKDAKSVVAERNGQGAKIADGGTRKVAVASRTVPPKQNEFNKCLKAVTDIDKQIDKLSRSARTGEPAESSDHKIEKVKARIDVNALFGDDEEDDDDVQVIEPKTSVHAAKAGPSKAPQPAAVVSKRVAHAATVNVRNHVPVRQKTPSAAEQMKMRYKHATENKPHVPAKKPLLENAHRENAVAASVAKGETRKAHFAKGDPKRVTLLEVPACKVPLGIRQMYIKSLYEDCLKVAPPDEAVTMAQDEEKKAASKAHGKSGYLAALSTVKQKLRAAATQHQTITLDGVSHSDVLAGRHAKSITIGASKQRNATRQEQLSEAEFYEILSEAFVLDYDQMRDNGYPLWDPFDDGVVVVQISERDRQRRPFVDDKDCKRVCCRCGTEYRIGPDGLAVTQSECLYHYGKAFKRGGKGQVETRYTCCDADLSVKGCVYGDCHVTNSQPMAVLKQFVETPRACGPGDTRSRHVYAMDCEMVYTTWGPEVARVTVVDIMGREVLDEIIRPDHPVLDYNSRFSGLRKEDVDNAALDLKQAQERLFEFINAETILIGHSLESDLKAMRLVHKNCVDTSVVFPHKMGPPHKKALKTLASDILKKIIQENESGHDSKEDAVVCIQIMLRKARDPTV